MVVVPDMEAAHASAAAGIAVPVVPEAAAHASAAAGGAVPEAAAAAGGPVPQAAVIAGLKPSMQNPGPLFKTDARKRKVAEEVAVSRTLTTATPVHLINLACPWMLCIMCTQAFVPSFMFAFLPAMMLVLYAFTSHRITFVLMSVRLAH